MRKIMLLMYSNKLTLEPKVKMNLRESPMLLQFYTELVEGRSNV